MTDDLTEPLTTARIRPPPSVITVAKRRHDIGTLALTGTGSTVRELVGMETRRRDRDALREVVILAAPAADLGSRAGASESCPGQHAQAVRDARARVPSLLHPVQQPLRNRGCRRRRSTCSAGTVWRPAPRPPGAGADGPRRRSRPRAGGWPRQLLSPRGWTAAPAFPARASTVLDQRAPGCCAGNPGHATRRPPAADWCGPNPAEETGHRPRRRAPSRRRVRRNTPTGVLRNCA